MEPGEIEKQGVFGRDCKGNKVFIGDTVVFSFHRNNNLYIGKVFAISKNFNFKIEIPRYVNYEGKTYFWYSWVKGDILLLEKEK